MRLDNVSAAVWGGGVNVLAIRADASFGSEHWYGGGGITRAVTLVRAPPQSFVESGVFVPTELAASEDVTTASAEWQDARGSGAPASVRFDVWGPAGDIIASNTTAAGPAPPGGTAIAGPVQLRFAPGTLQLWGTVKAALYTVTATLLDASGAPLDTLNVSVGFRRTRWDGATGFWLNGQPVKQRGFSHHNSFAGVGVAMPQRLDLFRVQVGREGGGKGRSSTAGCEVSHASTSACPPPPPHHSVRAGARIQHLAHEPQPLPPGCVSAPTCHACSCQTPPLLSPQDSTTSWIPWAR